MTNEAKLATAEIVHAPNPYDEAPQAITPMELMRFAIEKGTSIEQLEKLMDLNERWEAGEAKKAFQSAMAAFKAELPEILKNRTAEFESKKTGSNVSYEWADLGNVCQKLIPALSKHGITHNWRTEQKDGKVRVTCVLSKGIHSEDRATLEAMPDDTGAKNPIQAISSTVSYLERYTFTAACGVAVKGQDNDANAPVKWPKLQEYLDAIGLCHNLQILSQTFAEGLKAAIYAEDMKAAKLLAEARDIRKAALLKDEPA
jgi:hypothetical protein